MLLIPGASLCRECATEFGVGCEGKYHVPLEELVGDERWRRARFEEYEERLRSFPPLKRDERSDRLLARLGRHPVMDE